MQPVTGFQVDSVHSMLERAAIGLALPGATGHRLTLIAMKDISNDFGPCLVMSRENEAVQWCISGVGHYQWNSNVGEDLFQALLEELTKSLACSAVDFHLDRPKKRWYLLIYITAPFSGSPEAIHPFDLVFGKRARIVGQDSAVEGHYWKVHQSFQCPRVSDLLYGGPFCIHAKGVKENQSSVEPSVSDARSDLSRDDVIAVAFTDANISTWELLL